MAFKRIIFIEKDLKKNNPTISFYVNFKDIFTFTIFQKTPLFKNFIPYFEMGFPYFKMGFPYFKMGFPYFKMEFGITLF